MAKARAAPNQASRRRPTRHQRRAAVIRRYRDLGVESLRFLTPQDLPRRGGQPAGRRKRGYRDLIAGASITHGLWPDRREAVKALAAAARVKSKITMPYQPKERGGGDLPAELPRRTVWLEPPTLVCAVVQAGQQDAVLCAFCCIGRVSRERCMRSCPVQAQW